MPRITERLVRVARPRARKYEVCCTALRGFVLRVLPSGKRAYYVRMYEGAGDVRVRIGPTESMSLEEAKRRARTILFGDDVEPRAERELMRVERPVTPRSRRVPTLRAFVSRYLAEHVDRYLKPASRERYRGHIKHFLIAFGNRDLSSITRREVAEWHASMRDRPSAANNALRVLSGVFTKAIEWGVLDQGHENPARGVRKFREKKCERFLSPNERRRLEAEIRNGELIPAGRPGHVSWRIAAAIRLLALTGMRRSEVLDLEWSMVDYRHRCLRLPDSKTGQKAVPLGAPALKLLREIERSYRSDSPYVVYSTRGGKVQKATLGRAWRAIRARAGLDDVRLHDLRHSAASDALMSGVPLAVVGKILGHKQPATTARYAHIADGVLAGAVDAMSCAIAGHVPPEVRPNQYEKTPADSGKTPLRHEL